MLENDRTTQRGGETSSLHRKMTERHNGEEKPPIASKNAERHDEEVSTSSCCSSEAVAAVVEGATVVAVVAISVVITVDVKVDGCGGHGLGRGCGACVVLFSYDKFVVLGVGCRRAKLS